MAVPGHLQETGSRTPPPPADTKIHGYSSLLYKIMQNNAYSQLSTSSDFQLWTENTVFDLQLVESGDVNETCRRGLTVHTVCFCYNVDATKWCKLNFNIRNVIK